jgi:hypothetical protein
MVSSRAAVSGTDAVRIRCLPVSAPDTSGASAPESSTVTDDALPG